MSTALTAYTPTTPESAMMMATTLARSGLLSGDIQTPEQAFAIMAHGSELGLGPMTSLKGIIMVKGKVTLSAELMLHLIIRNGIKHEWLEDTDTVASVKLMRDGWAPYTSTFTMAEARKAGLTGGGNDMYAKYPRAMLRARAVSFGARAFCPDLLTGVYVHGELDDIDDNTPMQDVTAPEPEPKPETDEAKRERLATAPATWNKEERVGFGSFLQRIGIKYDDLKGYCLDSLAPKPSSASEAYRQGVAKALETAKGRAKFDAWLAGHADRAAHSDEAAHDAAADAEFEEVEIVEPPAALVELWEAIEVLAGSLDKNVVVDFAGGCGLDLSAPGGLRGITDGALLEDFKRSLEQMGTS